MDNNNFGHYNIFTSFDRPKLPFLGDHAVNSAVDSHHATAYGSGGSSSDDDENSRPSSTTTTPQRLPLFRRCPLTNRAGMVNEQQTAQLLSSPSKNISSGGKMKSSMSLSPLKNLSLNSPKKSAVAGAARSYQQSAVATSLFGRDDNNMAGLEAAVAYNASHNYAGYGDYDPLKGITSNAGNRVPQGLNLQYFINQERSNTINNSNNVSPNNSFSSSGSSVATEGVVRSLSYLDSLTNNNNNTTTFKTATYSQMARKEPSPPSTGLDAAAPRNTAGLTAAPVQTSYVPPANPKPATSSKNAVAKLSLDDVKVKIFSKTRLQKEMLFFGLRIMILPID